MIAAIRNQFRRKSELCVPSSNSLNLEYKVSHQQSAGSPLTQEVAYNADMPTLQQKIAETFLEKLGDAKEIDAAKLTQIKALLSSEKKPKAEDFVKVFSLPASGDVK